MLEWCSIGNTSTCHSSRNFFHGSPTPSVYTLSLHDPLPIFFRSRHGRRCSAPACSCPRRAGRCRDRKSTRLNSSHPSISCAVYCLKRKIIIRDDEVFLIAPGLWVDVGVVLDREHFHLPFQQEFFPRFTDPLRLHSFPTRPSSHLLPLAPWEAVLGTSVQLPTPGGPVQ